MNKDYIALDTDKKLRIYMHPLRQKILRNMEVCGKPMTAKQIADRLKIAPSSAVHHLKQLQEIGVIELDHTELIHGITAKFLRISPRSVQIGLDKENGVRDKEILVQNILQDIQNGFLEVIQQLREHPEQYGQEVNRYGEVTTGVVRLTETEFIELCKMIRVYSENHKECREGTKAYSFSFIGYQENIREQYEKAHADKREDE